MTPNNTTNSGEEIPPLTMDGVNATVEKLKSIADDVLDRQSKPLPFGFRWVEKVMRRFGWHRKYQIIVIDKTALYDWAWRESVTQKPWGFTECNKDTSV